MIRIIKPGQVEFKGYCDRCGCEFTYELVDIQLTGNVACPTCNKTIYHSNRTIKTPKYQEVSPVPGYLYELATPLHTYPKSCATCQLQGLEDQVGDSPCTWCPNGAITCLTDISDHTLDSQTSTSSSASNITSSITTAHNTSTCCSGGCAKHDSTDELKTCTCNH